MSRNWTFSRLNLENVITAVGVLTIVPVRSKPEELGKSISFFPLVGLLLGVCLVVLEYTLSYFLPTSIVRLIIIAFLIIITGGLHLDGLADTVDAVSSREKGDRALEIMKESTIGPIGASSIFIFLLAKYIALGEFFGGRLYAMLLLFPMIGRMGIVTACWMFPYAKKEGVGKAFIGNAGLKEFVIAGLISFISGFFLFGLRAVFILGFVILITVLIGKYFTKRFGGITGDILGFINEVSELVALIGGTVVI